MKSISGVISMGDKEHLTCCSSIQDLNIGGVSLYKFLDDRFNLDNFEFFDNSETRSPSYRLRYVILDEPPKEDLSLNSLAGKIIVEQISGDYVSGCYSEYTCGYGGFDYVINEGRSIFDELSGYIGKYIKLEI